MMICATPTIIFIPNLSVSGIRNRESGVLKGSFGLADGLDQRFFLFKWIFWVVKMCVWGTHNSHRIVKKSGLSITFISGGHITII
jgi:hypothetical protein